MIEVATIVHCCTDTVSKVIHMYNLPINRSFLGSCRKSKAVIQLNKETGNELQTFNSIADAGRWLVEYGYAKKYSGGVR